MLRTTGMRFIILSHWRSHHWPKMLATNMPVTSITTTTDNTPKPGMLRSQTARFSSPGITALVAPSTDRKMPSNTPYSQVSTQMVTPMGSHTSKPVMKYWRRRRVMKWVLLKRCGSMAGAVAAAASRRGGIAAGRRALTRRGGGGRRAARTAGAATEIGGVPARALELEAGSGQLLGKRGLAAGRAVGQRGVGDFLQNVLGMATGLTLVGVNGHGGRVVRVEDYKTLNYRRGAGASRPLLLPCLAHGFGLCKRRPRGSGHCQGSNSATRHRPVKGRWPSGSWVDPTR